MTKRPWQRASQASFIRERRQGRVWFERSGTAQAAPRRSAGNSLRPDRNALMLRAAWRSRWRVLDQRDADEPLAVFAEPDPRRDRDIGPLEQQLREFHRADAAKFLRDRRPGEHRRLGARDLPPGIVAAPSTSTSRRALIALADFGDAILRPVQRRRRRDLDRRERAVIEIGFDPRQRRDQPRIADREADPPAGHRIGLAQRGELDRDVARPRHFEDRGRRLAVEIDLGIGQVRQHDDVVMPAEIDDLAVEIEIDGLRRRIGREIEHDRERRRDGVLRRLFQLGEEIVPRADRHVAHRRAGHDEAEGVDRIARVRHQDRIARRGDRLRQIGQPLLRPERDDDLALRVEFDVEAARVIARRRRGAARRCRARSNSRASSGSARTRRAWRRYAAGSARPGCPCRDRSRRAPAARACAFSALTSAKT